MVESYAVERMRIGFRLDSQWMGCLLQRLGPQSMPNRGAMPPELPMYLADVRLPTKHNR